MVMEYNLINETNVNKTVWIQITISFLPSYMWFWELSVTLLALADNSPNAFLADLVFCLI